MENKDASPRLIEHKSRYNFEIMRGSHFKKGGSILFDDNSPNAWYEMLQFFEKTQKVSRDHYARWLNYFDPDSFEMKAFNDEHKYVFRQFLDSEAVNNLGLVFETIAEYGASKAIVIHLNPLAATIPSNEDLELTNRLIEAGNQAGITVWDHLKIGHSIWLSFLFEGYYPLLVNCLGQN